MLRSRRRNSRAKASARSSSFDRSVLTSSTGSPDQWVTGAKGLARLDINGLRKEPALQPTRGPAPNQAQPLPLQEVGVRSRRTEDRGWDSEQKQLDREISGHVDPREASNPP